MITLLEIADILTAKLGTENVTAGCIDASKDGQIGVYIRTPSVPEFRGASYKREHIRVLLHWNKSIDDTQKTAQRVSKIIEALRNEPTENHKILWTLPKGINLIGKDEKGICEAVVDADIIYKEE